MIRIGGGLGTKILGGACGVLLVTVLVFGWMNSSARANLIQAQANVVTLTAALDANEQARAELKAERDTLERVLAERIRKQEQIELESRERLAKLNRELNELRKAHEDVDVYLAVPVPAPLVEWLRAQTADNSRD